MSNMKVSELIRELNRMSQDGQDRDVILEVSLIRYHALGESMTIQGQGYLAEVYGEPSKVRLCSYVGDFRKRLEYPSGNEETVQF